MHVITYTRVSSAEQADSGAGLAAQRAAIAAALAQRGWSEVAAFEDAGVSAGVPPLERPALSRALDMLAASQRSPVGSRPGALVVAKLDRLARSVRDLVDIMELAKRQRWALVCLDVGVDTSTPVGELIMHILGGVAQFERTLIGQRTSEALQARKRAGVHVGRPSRVPEPVRQRIKHEREKGRSYVQIAAGLNEDEIPTPQGATRWRDYSVSIVYNAYLRELERRELAGAAAGGGGS